jgi:hypothetical protein
MAIRVRGELVVDKPLEEMATPAASTAASVIAGGLRKDPDLPDFFFPMIPPAPVATADTSVIPDEDAWFDANLHDREIGGGRRPRILVVLPSWRDADVLNTMLDLYCTAIHPARVYIMAVIQLDNNPQEFAWWSASINALYNILSSFGISSQNITVTFTHSDHIRGAGTARRLGWQYAGVLECDYLLSLDSHSRMALGWDKYLVATTQELVKRGYSQPCLTSLPWGFDVPSSLNTWAQAVPDCDIWSDRQSFVAERIHKVQSSWSTVTGGQGINSNIGTLNPIDFWKTLATMPENANMGNNPVRGSESIELKFLGYSVFGLPWYQGQFIANYDVRRTRIANRDIIDIGSMAYKIAGGFVFVPIKLARLIEFSTFMRTDDEVIPSMRLFRAGAELITPNKNVVYHWYERPGLPRPGWVHDVYMRAYDCISAELNLLGFSYDWRRDLQLNGTVDNVAGFVEDPDDIVLASMDGIRSYPKSKDFYYNRIGLYPRQLLSDLEFLECSGKRAVPALEYVGAGNKIRTFYLDIGHLATSQNITHLIGQELTIEMVGSQGQVVGSKKVILDKDMVSQDRVQLKGQQAVRLLCNVFCYVDLPIPRRYRVMYQNEELASSDLYTPRIQAHLNQLASL